LRAEAKKSGTVIVWAAVPRTPYSPLELKPGVGSAPLNRDDPDSDRLGVPQFPVDEDGSVRHFGEQVEVAKDSNGECPKGAGKDDKCYLPTFARAIYEAYTGAEKAKKKPEDGWFGDLQRRYCRLVPPRLSRCGEGERVIFNFHGDRYQFPIFDAKQFPEEVEHETRKEEEISGANTKIEIRRNAQFVDQVVLIGGSFPEARDEYFTPGGLMQGVELNALAIQTDLDGGGIRDVTWLRERLIDIGVSFYIVAIFYLFEGRPWKALRRSLVVIPMAFVFSLFLFHTPAYWFNFIPVAAGVFLHQLWELAHDGAEAQEKLRALRREQEQVEVDVATVEELAVTEIAEAGPVDPIVENTKVKRAASGAD
jgi:hypothetical protein